jgi:hypothetical protein
MVLSRLIDLHGYTNVYKSLFIDLDVDGEPLICYKTM